MALHKNKILRKPGVKNANTVLRLKKLTTRPVCVLQLAHAVLGEQELHLWVAEKGEKFVLFLGGVKKEIIVWVTAGTRAWQLWSPLSQAQVLLVLLLCHHSSSL